MLSTPMKNQNLQTLAALALFAAAMASRISTPFFGANAAWLENFSPISAICLCGAIYLSRKWSVIVPLSVVLVSDVILDTHYHRSMFCFEMLSRYVVFGLLIWLGWTIRKTGHAWLAIPAGIAGSLCFYLVTNTASWLSDPGYQKTFAGLVQSLTTGLPNYPSTWSFYRSTFLSDVIFTTLFVVCMAVTASRENESKTVRAATAVS